MPKRGALLQTRWRHFAKLRRHVAHIDPFAVRLCEQSQYSVNFECIVECLPIAIFSIQLVLQSRWGCGPKRQHCWSQDTHDSHVPQVVQSIWRQILIRRP
jgi:hypothetical protein